MVGLPVPVFYRDNGSLLLWHREDAGEALRVQRVLASRHAQGQLKYVEGSELCELEARRIGARRIGRRT
jgi:hypothetical protein